VEAAVPRQEEEKKPFVPSPLAPVFRPAAFVKLRSLIDQTTVLSERDQVKDFVSRRLLNGSFCIKSIQRAVAQDFMIKQGLDNSKPDGMDVRSMFDPKMFKSGATPVASRLKPDKMRELHSDSCDLCRDFYAKTTRCHPQCYYNDMDRCISHGWRPLIDAKKVRPIYSVRNSKNYTRYSTKAKEEFGAMMSDEVVVRLESFVVGVHHLNALGAIVKNSDIFRAKALTKIDIVDEESLLRASRELVARGFLKIKVRITIDCSGSGLNEAAYSPSFSMPGFAEALRRIYRDCFMSKGDVSRYFHSFPISKEFQDLLVVEYEEGIFFKYVMVPMGFTACPYYASTWTAEFRQWMLRAGLDPAMLMDDWFEVGDSLEHAQARMRHIAAILKLAGFDMAEDKFGAGQMMVFLGILIDSVSMTCRIEKVQAAGFKQQLLLYVASLKAGQDIDIQTVRHIAGKFSWYCEVLQSGRMHINSWWAYASTIDTAMPHRDLSWVIDDTLWWIDIMDHWEKDESSAQACKIFNSSEILANPRSFQLVQSDSSGIHGRGYVCSYYGQKDYKYYSKTWDTLPCGSHSGELQALLDYFRNDLVKGSLIMWITDSQSGAWTVNKGNCDDPVGRQIMAEILGLCDEFQCQLFALWIPREVNALPDHLSHLSVLLNRDEVSGNSLGDFA